MKNHLQVKINSAKFSVKLFTLCKECLVARCVAFKDALCRLLLLLLCLTCSRLFNIFIQYFESL